LVLLFIKWDKLTLGEIGLKVQNSSLPRFLSGFVFGIILVIIQVLIVSNFAEVTFTFSPNGSTINLISALSLYFIIACREELVFRSYALRSLAYAVNPIFALTTITILFIIEHVIGGMSWKMSIIGSGLGGILFGFASLKTKGLALPLGLHFSWNFTQWLFGFKNNTGVWKEIVEKGSETHAENVALLGFIAAMCLGIVGILVFYKKEKI
jgi:membrane protease YdiL (CAAX protease family)